MLSHCFNTDTDCVVWSCLDSVYLSLRLRRLVLLKIVTSDGGRGIFRFVVPKMVQIVLSGSCSLQVKKETKRPSVIFTEIVGSSRTSRSPCRQCSHCWHIWDDRRMPSESAAP